MFYLAEREKLVDVVVHPLQQVQLQQYPAAFASDVCFVAMACEYFSINEDSIIILCL